MTTKETIVKPKLIRVRAAEGKIIPIIAGVAHNTSARAFTPETPIVAYARNPLIRRLLKNGDLVEDAPTTPPTNGDLVEDAPTAPPAKASAKPSTRTPFAAPAPKDKE